MASNEEREQSCEERVEKQQAGREEKFRIIFQRDAPDAVESPAFALAYIEHAQNELDYDTDEDVQAVIDQFEQAVKDMQAGVTEDWESAVVEDSNETYAGDELGDAIETILADIATRTDDERLDKIDEEILNAEAQVTVTLRIELSTGGPADYVTADLDPRSRSISDIKYHFADWFDHAERSVDENSALGQLAAYYSESVTIESTAPDYDG